MRGGGVLAEIYNLPIRFAHMGFRIYKQNAFLFFQTKYFISEDFRMVTDYFINAVTDLPDKLVITFTSGPLLENKIACIFNFLDNKR